MAEPVTASRRGNRLTTVIVIALLLGTATGYVSHAYFPQSSPGFAETLSLLPTAFLRLVRMIIAPLVFSTLVVGIAMMGDVGTVGRIGVKALGWFLFASLVSLTLGLVLVDLLEPGTAMHLPIPAGDASTGLKAGGLTLEDFISHTIPTSVIDAMARNEILQIVVFSVFFGVAMAALGERTKRPPTSTSPLTPRPPRSSPPASAPSAARRTRCPRRRPESARSTERAGRSPVHRPRTPSRRGACPCRS